jgi:ATP-dependent Clp protease adapter protein ClpS
MKSTDNGILITLGVVGLLGLAGRARKGSFFKEGADDDLPIGTFDLDALLRGEELPAHPQECELWLLNSEDVDGYYVGEMLHEVFGLSAGQSSQLGFSAHRNGRALIQILDCGTARERLAAADAHAAARHPPAVGIIEIVELDD